VLCKVIKTSISKIVRTTRFWNMLKIVRLESQIMLKYLGALKPTGINRIAKIN